MKAIIKIFIALTILLSMPFTTQAGWVGPEELVTGTWGSGEGQFFFGYGDAEDVFPREFGVDSSGRIFINDKLNTRIQTYAKDGVLKKIINAPQGINSAFGWPYNIYIYSDGSIVASYEGPQKFFYDSAGNLVRKIDVYGAAHPTPQGYYFEVSKTQYILYSSTGQFIKMMTSRPLELGKVTSIALGGGQYKTTAEFPDITYQFTDTQPTVKFYRDLNRNFYRTETFTVSVGGENVTAYKIHKYNACSKKISLLDMPRSSYEPMPPSAADMPTWKPAPIIEYGEPNVTSNGDVYAWARTKTNYKILKWTWVDDPNVPTGPDEPSGLAVIPSIDGLYLTWTASPNDPGCVTKYEIARATTSGGVFSTVGTVEKGILKYNDTSAEVGTQYYYKVRAMAGSDPSLYTGEASGKR